MTTQFRNTQFGHLVRFLSGNKLFRCPDEIDPSLWKKSLQRDATSISTRSGKQSGGSEKSKDPNDSTHASTKGFDAQDVNLQDQSVGKDIYLVDWYGPDDPEVSAPIGSMRQIFLTQFRIPRIGLAAGSC